MDEIFQNLRRASNSSSDEDDLPDDTPNLEQSANYAFNVLGCPSLGIRAKVCAAPKAKTQLQLAAKAWDKIAVLRQGDRLQRDFVNPDIRLSACPTIHKNSWDISGLCREGFREVGKGGSARRGDISHTNRELDVLPLSF